jgi:hypothetical protein
VIPLLDNKGVSSSEYGESRLSVLLVPTAEFSHRADQSTLLMFAKVLQWEVFEQHSHEQIWGANFRKTITLKIV